MLDRSKTILKHIDTAKARSVYKTISNILITPAHIPLSANFMLSYDDFTCLRELIILSNVTWVLCLY